MRFSPVKNRLTLGLAAVLLTLSITVYGGGGASGASVPGNPPAEMAVPVPVRNFIIHPVIVLVAALVVFSVIGAAAAIRGIVSAAAENAAAKAGALALVNGDFLPAEKKRHIAEGQPKGPGLRFKISAFTIVLVLLVVVMVSVPLYHIMINTRRETLLHSLRDRSTVLMDGLSASVYACLSTSDMVELSLLPAQSAAIPEARYITITGPSADSGAYGDYVWASNDPDIFEKINEKELRPGISRLNDPLSPRLEQLWRNLNDKARVEAGPLARSITALNREAAALAFRSDHGSLMRLNDIQAALNSLEAQLANALRRISSEAGSEPDFSIDYISSRGNTRFIFFKPVMYPHASGDGFFRGLIRMEVSVNSIIREIGLRERLLMRTILAVAFAAIAIGTIGALILSALIIKPIRQLVQHVEIIRDTEDKTSLAGVDIKIASHDEIAMLGDTINDMTHALVRAAAAASDLSIGREIQKKFLPLELDRNGNKLSTGFKDTKNAQFFGYYEGAKGISGDYFDYQDLDGRYYAIIKCDVAGKGIPAALIMIQVATMFLNYCKNWRPSAKGMHIEEVVYQINGFIETLGFQGRFAAFSLCLFDSETGAIHFCNAGDNVVHIFDSSEGRFKTVTLPASPAAGVLPNSLVETKGGYRVQSLFLDHGDMLILYTDGIEEAKRKFRDAAFNEILCPGGTDGEVSHENHVAGQNGEEMGTERVRDIINAVMNRELYTLYKWHNPEGNRNLQFDFSDCRGSIEEIIMALISAEKMFRCYRVSGAGEESRVLVDKKIDTFLKAHFLQYRVYCSRSRESPGNDAHLYYTCVQEDELYDDLSILGIKRK
jgi:serine phosphatase RsbU (regulator of sigma subunit)